MLANSSDSPVAELKSAKTALTSAKIHWSGRVLMLLLNFLPAIHVVLIIGLLWMSFLNWPARIGAALAALYLLPPLVARLVLFILPISQGRIAVGGKAFFSWWATFQLQVLFCRLPFLEETLRLIPGLYSFWLRLWGSRIGRLTYWAAGTIVTDRSFLRVGDDVVFGAGVRLNAHVLAKNKEGEMELLLADLKIRDRVIVGGYSLITAGAEISSDEATRAEMLLPPFSIWKDGKRIKHKQFDETD